MAEITLFQPKCGIWDIMGIRSPTGLLHVASVPVKKGYDVKLIDQRLCKNWKEEIKKHIRGAKIFGLTAMIGEQIKYIMEVAEYVRSIDKNILIVLGGTWAQTKPDVSIKDKNIDVVCYGEGDLLITELMDYLNGKKKIEKILGIYYKNNGKIKINPPTPLIENLDELPKVPYKLINPKNYTAVGFREGMPSISLILSRGCPYRCAFCSISYLFHRKWRGYSIKRVLEDLEEIEKKYGIKDFYFNDDNISGNLKFFKEFVKALAESKKDYNWGTAGIRADTILNFDDETMENIVKSGCKNLDVGVESGNPRVLKLIKKDETLETIRKANKKLRKYPIIIKYSFMGGFPTETKEEFLDTLKFRRILMEENPNAVGLIFLYTPFPGTEMFALAVKQGLRPPKTLKGWADFNYDTWYKKFPSWLTKDKIKLIENSVFLSYFDSKNLSYKYPNPLMNFLFKMYSPLAKYRSENHKFGFFIEKNLADLIAKLNEKTNLFAKFKRK